MFLVLIVESRGCFRPVRLAGIACMLSFILLSGNYFSFSFWVCVVQRQSEGGGLLKTGVAMIA